MNNSMLTALTTFEAFPKFPFELRAEIWRHAIHDIPSQVVMIQPDHPNSPATSRTCQGSRLETLKTYTLAKSRRGIFFFDSAKDTLFINKTPIPRTDLTDSTPLHSAISSLIPFIKPLQILVLRLEDTKPLLPSVWPAFSSYNGRDLWAQLGEWCPNLKKIYLVTAYLSEPSMPTENDAQNVANRNQVANWVNWQMNHFQQHMEEITVKHDFYLQQLGHGLNLGMSLVIAAEGDTLGRIVADQETMVCG